MKTSVILIRDFFSIALGTWLVLVFLEFCQPGMVERQIDLEYYFYGLIFLYILYRLIKK